MSVNGRGDKTSNVSFSSFPWGRHHSPVCCQSAAFWSSSIYMKCTLCVTSHASTCYGSQSRFVLARVHRLEMQKCAAAYLAASLLEGRLSVSHWQPFSNKMGPVPLKLNFELFGVSTVVLPFVDDTLKLVDLLPGSLNSTQGFNCFKNQI